MKKVLLIVGLIVVAFLIFFMFEISQYNKRGDQIHATTKTILNLMRAGDYQKLAPLIATESKSSIDANVVANLAKSMPMLTSFDEIVIKTVTPDVTGPNGKKAVTVNGVLAKDNRKTNFQITLIDAGNGWQLFNIDLKQDWSPATDVGKDDKKATFVDIQMGTGFNDTTYQVENPSATFDVNAEKIYFVAEVKNSSNSVSADFNLKYDNTGVTVVDSYKTFAYDQNGNSLGKFWVTKPTNGWPKGTYTVSVKLANGQAGTKKFTVK